MQRWLLPVLLLSLALPTLAAAAPERERDHDRAGLIRGGLVAPPKRHALPAGELEVSPAIAPAGLTSEVTFTIHLDRDADGAALLAELPQTFVERAASGLRYAGTPRLRTSANGRATSSVSGRDLTVDMGSALAGSNVSFSIDVSGLPAGEWPIALRWRDAHGGTRQLGTAAFALVPARREPGSEEEDQPRGVFGKLAPVRLEQDVSSDGTEESETFVAANPANPDRVVSAANDISDDGTGGVFLSDDAGRSFTELHFPTTFSLPGGGSEHEVPDGDPIAAADDLGNIWVGGLSLCTTATTRSHIFVNRIAAGTSSFRPANAAIPFVSGDGGGNCGTSSEAVQDKPQMTIDDWPGSPTYGRLYVTWDDFDLGGADKGSVHEVISFCDTRGVSGAALCDSGANWSTPVRISDSGGSYITSDPAVGPDGTVYVAWWDYSANNRISIDHCATNCGSAASWGTDATVAVLSQGSGTQASPQVPFACPIIAQPGGRAAPVPSVATAADGRLYVAWSDLRSGSGITRCDIDPDPQSPNFGTPPLLTHETFDSLVATAPDFATLTAGATTTSATRGTRIFADTDTTPTATNSDDWFPWVAVDHSTGNAYVDVYSTVGDATRRAANFYLATVTPPASGTKPTIGTPNKLTAVPSDYSQSTDPVPGGCCQFQNDYGDYEGLAAAGGVVYPIWAFRTGFGDDGDIHMDVAVRRPRATTGDASDVSLTTATLSGTVNPGGSETTYHFYYGPTTGYGSHAPTTDGDAGSDAADHAVAAALSGLAPGTTYHYRLVASNCGGCSGGTFAGSDRVFTTAGEPAPPTTSTTPTPPPVDRTRPRLKVTYGRRADRRGRYTIRLAAAGEAASGRATLRLATGRKRSLGSKRIATTGSRSMKLVIKLKRKDLKLLKRKHRLRVRVAVSLTDLAGNTARASKTFTLRLKR